jgi:O-antigen/teichoic acid export membrane protein
MLDAEKSPWLASWLASRWPKGGLSGRFARGGGWTFASTLTTNLSGLLVGVGLARMLGRDAYGELGVLMSTYALFSQLGSLGLGMAALKHMAECRENDPQRAGRVTGLALQTATISYGVTAALVCLLAPHLARFINAPHLAAEIRLIGVLLLLLGIDSVQGGLLGGLEAFHRTARINMARAACHVPLALTGCWLAGLPGVLGVMILLALLTVVLNRRALDGELARFGIRPDYTANGTELKRFLAFSIPSFLGGCLTVPVTWATNAMLVNHQGGYAQMGLLSAANQWRAVATLVPGVFNSVFLSIQTNLIGAGQWAQYRDSLMHNLRYQSLAASAAAGALAAFSPWIMGAYGGDYAQGAPVLALLAAGWLFLAPNWIIWNVFMSAGKVWLGLALNLLGALLLLLLAWLWVGRGALGLAGAMLVSSAAQVAVMFLCLTRWLKGLPTEDGGKIE